MWIVQYLVFICLGVFFLLLSIRLEDHPFWNLIGSIVSTVIWLILSISQIVIDIPYIALLSNDTIITGYYSYTDPIAPFLAYFFLALFWLNFIYLFAMVWDKWYNYKNWHGGN